MMNISVMRDSKGPFRLKKINDSIFQIHSKTGPAYEGTKAMIWAVSERMGVRRPDLDEALDEMEKLGHDTAEFGIGGGFIYTSNSKKKVA